MTKLNNHKFQISVAVLYLSRIGFRRLADRGPGGGGGTRLCGCTHARPRKRIKRVLFADKWRVTRVTRLGCQKGQNQKKGMFEELTNTRLGYLLLQTCFPDLSRVCRGFCATSNKVPVGFQNI